MTLQTSGTIWLSEIAAEFGDTAPHYLSEFYRGGGKVPNAPTTQNIPTSGYITMGNFYGAANRIPLTYTISTNTEAANINIQNISGYVAGVSDVTIVVNSGVYVYSTNTSTPALTISGAQGSDTIKLINYGYIMGQGGNGAWGAAGGNGGTALSIYSNITIDNTSTSAYIGGGGGGGGAANASGTAAAGGGGGAGGGSGSGPSGGGAGGGVGASGSDGTGGQLNAASSGGGGGRVFPGTGGAGGVGSGSTGATTSGKGGTGGGGGGGSFSTKAGRTSGGAGGSANAAGSPAVRVLSTTAPGGGGGGGWGASGGVGLIANASLWAPGAGGKAVSLNGFSVTWTGGFPSSQIFGAVS